MADAILSDLEKQLNVALCDTIGLVEIFKHVHEIGFDSYARLARAAMERVNDAADNYLSAKSLSD